MTEEQIQLSEKQIENISEIKEKLIELINALWELLQEIIPPIIEAIHKMLPLRQLRLHRKKRINKKVAKEVRAVGIKNRAQSLAIALRKTPKDFSFQMRAYHKK